MKSFLHVGCGHLNKSHAKGFDNDNWSEIRFDIDKNVNPDIEGTLLDMSAVETGSIDAIYSCHNIEHVFPHEVAVVLKEFLRVLNDDGMVVVLCPDLQSVAESILQDKLLDPLYESDAGPIAPIDILYGLRLDLEKGNHYMAHKCGFTYSSLLGCFIQAGFKKWIGGRKPDIYELCLVACKGEKSNTLASQFLP